MNLLRLITQGEGLHLDFKFEISDSRKIARSLVAFANTDGGRLLIGVKDNGAIAGVRSDEEYYMIQAAADLYCKPIVTYTPRTHTINGRTVLEIEVPRSETVPHKAQDDHKQWKAYVRVNDQNIVANEVILQKWVLDKRKKGLVLSYSMAEHLLTNLLEENKSFSLEQYYKLAHIARSEAIDTLARFIVLGIVGYELTEKDCFYFAIK